MMTKEHFYLDWEPAITPEEVFADIVGLSEIKLVNGSIYWLEFRPAEKGRYVIVERKKDNFVRDITPKGFNVRNRVHEYGGGSYTINKNRVYFVNFSDQRLYSQRLPDGIPEALTPEKAQDGALGKYAALELSPDGRTLYFVYEKEYQNKENKNMLGCLDLSSHKEAEPIILAEGNDFYASPKVSRDGKKIAWLTWNHPFMPWESTMLMLADLHGAELENTIKVAGGKKKAVCQHKFGRKGNLYFAMDEAGCEQKDPKNWWNLYQFAGNNVKPVTQVQAEFGIPMWVFGTSTYAFTQDGKIVASMIKGGKGSLCLIDPVHRNCCSLLSKYTEFSYLNCKADRLFCVVSSPGEMRKIVGIAIPSMETEVIKVSTSISMDENDISLPEHITYPTQDGDEAHGYVYAPKNHRYIAPEGEKPPLLVMAHGGPTSRASDSLSLSRQFWTSQGYCVLDVDYRGSTGYGRHYRDKLKAMWGIVDAGDAADGVRFLLKQGKAAPHMVAVRGGSAGGYLVQCVLTKYPELFTAGASYFGIGNLITMVKEIHKFEAKYDTYLIGATYPKDKEVFEERSPINHLNRLKAPMIIFQGADDKIVTPENSREMARILEKKGIPYEYIEYEDEAHGFRQKEHNIDALNKESSFYRSVFKREL